MILLNLKLKLQNNNNIAITAEFINHKRHKSQQILWILTSEHLTNQELLREFLQLSAITSQLLDFHIQH
ncbi:CLUMA_CG014085, isoform A [Clunio marinus]|uniref:CLUMA_CG014085, isoform A n=1 Tax=Clunio marinus TaxID=568069 RepID=A0A1J1IM71_9DIPT|nr:CLUMA_CG014085, isoform A [Clunio marinus]